MKHRILAHLIQCPTPRCAGRHSIRVSQLGRPYICLTCRRSYTPTAIKTHVEVEETGDVAVVEKAQQLTID